MTSRGKMLYELAMKKLKEKRIEDEMNDKIREENMIKKKSEKEMQIEQALKSEEKPMILSISEENMGIEIEKTNVNVYKKVTNEEENIGVLGEEEIWKTGMPSEENVNIDIICCKEMLSEVVHVFNVDSDNLLNYDRSYEQPIFSTESQYECDIFPNYNPILSENVDSYNETTSVVSSKRGCIEDRDNVPNAGPECYFETQILSEKNIFLENNKRSENDVVGEEGKRKKKINQRNENKKKKNIGLEYKNRKGVIKPAKYPKPIPCKGKCINDCQQNVKNEEREFICKTFWDLGNYQMQNNFILSNIDVLEKKRKYVKGESRRNVTLNYFLPLAEGKQKVCKMVFLNTLNISAKKVTNCIKNQNEIGSPKDDNRGKHTPKNKTPTALLNYIEYYIKSLPAVPSHYCRGSTTKKYLPIEFKNLTNLYTLYKKHCSDKNKITVSERIFKDIFRNKFNVGFHVPKKDKCFLCERFKNTPEIERSHEDKLKLENHENEKELSKQAFKADQILSKEENGFLCISFDLQKVLNTPQGSSMLLYYSRKYAFFNLTVYESGTRKGTCYLWGECNGKRGANEICSIMNDYLVDVDKRGNINNISLYCDSCPGQNKNSQILTMIFYTLKNSINLKVISITYLVPGHTVMPVDSVHATIERAIKKKTIWAPSEWPTIITNARNHPEPYEIKLLTHKDFYDWKFIQQKVIPLSLSNETGNRIKYKDLRRVTFVKDSNTFSIKYSLEQAAHEETYNIQINKKRKQSTTATTNLPELKPLYKCSLPIALAKFKDLKKLCTDKVIPQRYHSEYTSMTHSATVDDVLIDSDVEDNNYD